MVDVPVFQGAFPGETNETISLHLYDKFGPIHVILPTEGVTHMCGRTLAPDEIGLVMAANVTKLDPLFNSVLDAKGDFTIAMFENGASYRRLDIGVDDVKKSGITISTEVLKIASGAGFANPITGKLDLPG